MFETTSASSPNSASSSDPFLAGELKEIETEWRRGLAPDPMLTVSEWADTRRVLSSRSAPEPGPYRTSRTPFMRDIMNALSAHSPYIRVVFMKATQVGAPLAQDTEIPTLDGWKTMRDIAVGDVVFDERGTPANVIGVSPIFERRQCFAVRFSDGAEIVADASHLWTVLDFTKGIRERTLTTEEIAAKVRIGEYRNRYGIPVTHPLSCDAGELPVGPYTLGAWLGDGNSCSNQITTHVSDAHEMASYIRAEGHEATVRVTDRSNPNARNILIDAKPPRGDICRRGHDLNEVGVHEVHRRGRVDLRCAECGRQSALASKYQKPRPDPVIREPRTAYYRLKRLGLIGNKHIPIAYLRSSIEQRQALLQGLIDTDGHIDQRGRCELTICGERLNGDALELIRSLGYKPTVYRRLTCEVVRGKKVRQRKWHNRISFLAYADRPIARLKRKASRQVSSAGRRSSETNQRRIVEVRPVQSVPTRCISVDSKSHLFLAGRAMIPTHNSEAGNNWVGYSIDQVPAPFLLVQPTSVLAKRYSQQRIDPMIETTPVLSARVMPARARDSGNTVFAKTYPGGILILTGANSATGLRSMPARFIFGDEIDAYPPDIDDEGDPIKLAERRASNFGHRKKLYLVSTPTLKGLSRIEDEYEATDQRRYFVPCPHCGAMQWLQFPRLIWTKGDPGSAVYRCEHCETDIEEHHKTKMLEHGEWQATANCPDPKVIGFHISALYSPLGWMSWAEVAKEWEGAQGNESLIKTFKNTILGESFQEKGDAPDWKRLYDRKREHVVGSVPAWVLLITAGVDVQRNRLEASFWGWGYGLESALIEHIIVEGDVAKEETWDRLAAELRKTFRRDGDGLELKAVRWGVDTGDGATTTEAYSFCRKHRGLAVALKGRGGFAVSPVEGPRWAEITERGRKIKNGVRLYTVYVDVFKSETYRYLRLDRPTDEEFAAGADFPDGYIHIPQGAPEEWFKQLTAEQLVAVKSKRKRALVKLEWVKLRERNEALDCRVYARAAARLVTNIEGWPSKALMRKPLALPVPEERKIVPSPVPEPRPQQAPPTIPRVEERKPEPPHQAAAKPQSRDDVLRAIRERAMRARAGLR